MIVYKNNVKGFVEDVRDNIISDRIEEKIKRLGISGGSEQEVRSWANSLQYVRNVVDDKEIDSECEIAIEYQIPLTSKRVDFLISGINNDGQKNVIIMELKQWENCEPIDNYCLVKAYFKGGMKVVAHPSYQAFSYARIIGNFNEEIFRSDIQLYPLAYLHNFKEIYKDNIINEKYQEVIDEAPVFIKTDTKKLRDYIKGYLTKSCGGLIQKIDYGKIRPSKSLQDSIVSMIKGNKEFTLIDEQIVAFESIKKIVNQSLGQGKNTGKKYVILVEGGPGTGKSIIAIQLLSKLIAQGKNVAYVTKNSQPREVYSKLLREGKMKKVEVDALFKTPFGFVNLSRDLFDCLLIDEAHRLTLKNSTNQRANDNTIKEMIKSSKVCVFFCDDHQRVTYSDIGSMETIKKFALEEDAEVISGSQFVLASQFRCNGSDGYLNFVDDLLEIKKTANSVFDLDYDFKVYDSLVEMKRDLKEKNENYKSRLVAGYCYNWITKKNNEPDLYDIVLENGNFKAKWNLDRELFILEDSFERVGCIHTVQGLEVQYIGVIIGKDLYYDGKNVRTDYTKRAKTDKSLHGFKKANDYKAADEIIRNTYRTLLTRGQKGCYVYCEDENLREYIKSKFKRGIL